MNLWTKLKYWWLIYTGGIVTPPEEPVERLTLEEALEIYLNEDEWEEDDQG